MAALAKITVRLPRNPSLFESHRLDVDARTPKETIKLALRHCVAAIVDHQSCLK